MFDKKNNFFCTPTGACGKAVFTSANDVAFVIDGD
jgi:hypothetical protein